MTEATVHAELSANVEPGGDLCIRTLAMPADTNAKVVSESLLGGMIVVLEPGGDKTMIPPGGEIEHTQGAVPLSELIAKFMFGSTGSK